MRLADHAEQGFLARLAVDHPGSVEDFVPTMFRVGLREHHQFDVGRVALRLVDKQIDEIIDLILRQRHSEADIGFNQRVTTTGEQIN